MQSAPPMALAAAAFFALWPQTAQGSASAASFTSQSIPALGAAVPEGLLFGICLQAVGRGRSGGSKWKSACLQAFGSLPGQQQQGLEVQCAKFGGRASEAEEQGYLGNGTLLCGRLVRERALATGNSLAAFLPAACVDGPTGWSSYSGASCADYDSNEWCTAARGYGAGWEAAWGSFDHYAVDGASADEACCACGGGRPGDAEITVAFCDAVRTEALDACAAAVERPRDADATAASQLRSGHAAGTGQQPASSTLTAIEAMAAPFTDSAPPAAENVVAAAAAAAAGGAAASGTSGIWAFVEKLWQGTR